jgi:hypothetical protein
MIAAPGKLLAPGAAVLVIVYLLATLSQPLELRLLPLLIGTITLAMLGLLSLPALARRLDRARSDRLPGLSRLAPPASAAVAATVGWLLGFLSALVLLGFTLTTPPFIALYLYHAARLPLLPAMLASAAGSLLILGAFALLRISLWPGLIPELMPGVVGGGVLPPL